MSDFLFGVVLCLNIATCINLLILCWKIREIEVETIEEEDGK